MLRHRTRVIICSNLGRVRVESRITIYYWMKSCEGAVAKSQTLSAGIQLIAFAYEKPKTGCKKCVNATLDLDLLFLIRWIDSNLSPPNR